MPTYVCSVPAGSLTIMQKTVIAEAIDRIHNEAAGAPQFLVQVIIDENQSVDRTRPSCIQRMQNQKKGDCTGGLSALSSRKETLQQRSASGRPTTFSTVHALSRARDGLFNLIRSIPHP